MQTIVLKLMANRLLKWLKNEAVKFRISTRKIKASFMIYADFEIILIPQNNGLQNPDDSCTEKYQNHVICSHGYKLVYIDDQFSTLFNSFLS